MKFNILVCFMIVISGMILPSIAISTNKVDKKGKYLPYYGYTIIAKVNPELAEYSERIQEFIRTSSFKKSYSALPADTYHMSIFTIYSIGKTVIAPVQRWLDISDQEIPKRGLLPDDALEEQNNKATCILDKILKEPLTVEYASLSFGDTIISLKLKLDGKSLIQVKKARKELTKIYEHSNSKMEPIGEKVHLTFAYAYKKPKLENIDDWNKINEMARLFNGANFSLPAVYLFKSMKDYTQFTLKDYFDCSEFLRSVNLE